jgi:hypothetical protein
MVASPPSSWFCSCPDLAAPPAAQTSPGSRAHKLQFPWRDVILRARGLCAHGPKELDHHAEQLSNPNDTLSRCASGSNHVLRTPATALARTRRLDILPAPFVWVRARPQISLGGVRCRRHSKRSSCHRTTARRAYLWQRRTGQALGQPQDLMSPSNVARILSVGDCRSAI